MLKITVSDKEFYDEETNEFLKVDGATIQMEHSLIALAKWESRYHKPFLSTDKSSIEMLDYIQCMTITQNVNPLLFRCLSTKEVKLIDEYIEDSMTATWFSDNQNNASTSKTGWKPKETVTAEIIYYWMIALNIPIDFEKWHLSRLLTLINVVQQKSNPKETLSHKERAALNAARRKKYKTRG